MGTRVQVGGEYEILEKLGAGGMGEVFKARHRGTGGFERLVVIKRILPHLGSDGRVVEMFLSEARLMARLVHPNVVQVLTLGQDAAGYFIATEYVAGQTLNRVLGALEGRRPPVGLGVLVARDLCRALAYAYDLRGDDGLPLQLVHRDVSPSNVLLGMSGEVKLFDFGVAKMLAANYNPATETGVLKGKLSYMAPERIAGQPFDQRADLFSVGVMLHESLTGQRLLENLTLPELASGLREPIAPPSRINPHVPPELDAICLEALSVDPARRFASGHELAAALERVLFELKWGPSELAALMRALFSPVDSELPFAATLLGVPPETVRGMCALGGEDFTSLAVDTSAGDTVVDNAFAPRADSDTVQVTLTPPRVPEETKAVPGLAVRSEPLRDQQVSGEISMDFIAQPAEPTRSMAAAATSAISGMVTRVPPKRTGWLATAIAAALAAAVLGLWLGARAGEHFAAASTASPATPNPSAASATPATPTATMPAAATASPGADPAATAPPSANEAEALVTMRVDSEPSGAGFVLGDAPGKRGGLRGRTPFVGHVPRSTALRLLTVSLPGFEPATVRLRLSADVEVQLHLRPTRAH